mmetsp:Transcript_57050/g.150303  ORF Transcript_57050/g.150303 Transcript_57050/m.150303 type:complete len:176 (+) Transcript_57050:1119-1646(+)
MMIFGKVVAKDLRGFPKFFEGILAFPLHRQNSSKSCPCNCNLLVIPSVNLHELYKCSYKHTPSSFQIVRIRVLTLHQDVPDVSFDVSNGFDLAFELVRFINFKALLVHRKGPFIIIEFLQYGCQIIASLGNTKIIVAKDAGLDLHRSVQLLSRRFILLRSLTHQDPSEHLKSTCL